MSIHRYPLPSLLVDGLRAIVGMMATLGPLIFLDPIWPLAAILGGLGFIFAVFGLKLLQQSFSSIEISDDGIAGHGPVVKAMAWSDITTLKLAHYATPRRPLEGWYQLILKGRGGAFKIDSTIEGFDLIVGMAAQEAETSGVVFDPTTSENLRILRQQGGRLS
ncbi:MAG: hypothetical protein AAF543_19435 [Pseudomonadota bacterium]